MSSKTWVSLLVCPILSILLAAACTDGGDREFAADAGGGWTGVCIDVDGDGYGFQCAQGSDCNDQDPTIQAGCGACDLPSEGCACPEGTQAVDCTLPYEVTAAGSLICRDGTRYCRDGQWTACEGIRSFEAQPPPAASVKLQAVVQADAAVSCGVCNPDCWQIEDKLSPAADAGSSSFGDSGVTYGSGGGITLGGSGSDAAVKDPDKITPVPPCDEDVDADCDGIPDALDPFPGAKPFESEHATIFMDLPPGTSGSTTFDLRFYLKTADIYFLIDMTGSMEGERDNLISSLQTGNYLNNPSTLTDESAAVVCADRDFDGSPDDDLKDEGIAGNIACLIRSSAFGAGWYREVPFSARDSYGIRYSYPNFSAYEHRLDITEDVGAVDSALNLFVTRGNQNVAEAGMVALSAVATGGAVHMGWDRPGIPPRVCPDSTRFGWPCFRSDAMPIVVLVTDAPFMNGPDTATQHLGYDGNFSRNQPVNYEANGLRYMSKSSDGAYYPVSGNESLETAYDVGAIDTSFKTYTGDTRGMTADIHAGTINNACAAEWPSNASSASSPGHPDAVFKFTVASTKNLTISTRGTHFMPTLAIVSANIPPRVAVAAVNNATPAAAQQLPAFTPTTNLRITGDTDPTTFTTGDLPASALTECLRGVTTSTLAPDAWFKFTPSQDLTNVSFAVAGGDFDGVLGLWTSPPVPPTTVTTAALGTNDKFFTTAAALTPGTSSAPGAINDRSVFLTGGATNASGFGGDYGPSLFTGFSGADSSCAGVSGTVKDAVVDFQVTGTTARTVRIETTASSDILGVASFDHVIGLFTRPTASNRSFTSALACNRNAVSVNRSAVTRSLNPGTYSVIVRGEVSRRRSPDQGTYGLLISDAATRPLACHRQSASASFTANLKSGQTYYLGMRGRTTATGGGRGPYTISIMSSSSAFNANCAFDNTPYASRTDDNAYDLDAAEITRSFTPGDYYAIIKGRDNIDAVPSSDAARGWYQITFGDQTLQTTNQVASMPAWGSATSGVMKSLVDRNIRVITVAATLPSITTNGTATLDQAKTIATATKALGPDGKPLVFEIGTNGTGMGFAVVDAINRLAQNVSMDVSVRHVPLPDVPPKPFGFNVRAIAATGNSCTGVKDTTMDGIPDTHVKCAPGATPRFEITFTNPPAPNNVPPNTDPDSKGGYNMRLELIADGQYVIDTTPVFIIPQDVVPDPPKYQYQQQGVYIQDVIAGCSGTDRPSWQALTWNAGIPAGTVVDWSVCAGDSAAELDACAAGGKWASITTITPGADCTSTPCVNGYCSAEKICHEPKAPLNSCTGPTDAICAVSPTNGQCVSLACAWTSNEVSLAPALKAGLNGKSRMRLQVKLTADGTRTAAPTVHDYRLKYVCSPGV